MAQFNSKNKADRVARRWFTDFDINMKNHPITGDIVLKYDLNAIKRAVMNLVMTNYYERPFKPSLGANLRGKLFELNDAPNRIVLEDELKELLNTFEPRATFNNIMTSPDINENALNITIMFTVRNSPQPHSLDLILERVR
jgi:phage baseplate assembly protein W